MLRFRDRVLRFRVLGASCFGLRFRVLRFRNYPQVTSRASLGKPIVSIGVERRSLVNLSTSLSLEEGT